LGRSEDESISWNVISTQGGLKLIETSDGIFYKTHQNNVWKSFDKGYTWQKTPDFALAGNNYDRLGPCLIEADNGKIYSAAFRYGFNDGYVFQSEYSSSSETLMVFSPAIVNQWLAFSNSSLLNGGQIICMFAYSTNKGTNYSTWTALENTNLQKVKCLANGNDRLKVKATLFSLNHDATPEMDWFSVRYDAPVNLPQPPAEFNSLDNVVIAPNPFNPNSSADGITLYFLISRLNLK